MWTKEQETRLILHEHDDDDDDDDDDDEKKLRGLSPRANYTDRAAAAGRRS